MYSFGWLGQWVHINTLGTLKQKVTVSVDNLEDAKALWYTSYQEVYYILDTV